MKTKSILSNLATVMVLFTFVLFFNESMYAQQDSWPPLSTKTPSTFLGIGLGINDNGFGGCIEIPLIEKLSLYGNAGLGGWGWKLGGGISFYPSKGPYGTSFSIGYASASGFKNFETELAVEPDNQNKLILLNLNPVGTVNLVYAHNFRMGQKSKFALSAGYAIPVTKNAYDVITTGETLSDISMQVMDIMQPGGLIVGFKFLFGIN